MDNIIKLPAQQALFNATNRLVDLVIPGNSGVYNLSESYIAIDLALLTQLLLTFDPCLNTTQQRQPFTTCVLCLWRRLSEIALCLRLLGEKLRISDELIHSEPR